MSRPSLVECSSSPRQGRGKSPWGLETTRQHVLTSFEKTRQQVFHSFVSCVVCCVSCVVCRVLCVVCRVSCVVCRVSCPFLWRENKTANKTRAKTTKSWQVLEHLVNSSSTPRRLLTKTCRVLSNPRHSQSSRTVKSSTFNCVPLHSSLVCGLQRRAISPCTPLLFLALSREEVSFIGLFGKRDL